MRRLAAQFASEERAQDLIEYTLLIGFVSLVAACIVINIDPAFDIWDTAESVTGIAAGNTSAASTSDSGNTTANTTSGSRSRHRRHWWWW